MTWGARNTAREGHAQIDRALGAAELRRDDEVLDELDSVPRAHPMPY